jgi:hypothetical protein
MMPVSKAAKQASIRDTLTLFIQNGQPLDPRILRKVTRDLDVGGDQVFFADVTEGLRQTKREHRYMYNGQGLPINTFDDDDLHIAEHQEEQRSSRYFKLMLTNPQAAGIFEQHVMLHMNRRTQAQEQQQQQQLDQMRAQAGMDTQQQMTVNQQNNEAENQRLMLQQHFQDIQSQRDAELKMRQIQSQEQIAQQRNQGQGRGNNNG